MIAGRLSAFVPRPIAAVGIVAQAGEGLRLIGGDRLLRALAVAQMLAALSAAATSALLVVLAMRQLHTAGGGYGLLLAAIAAGAFVGPILLARLRLRMRGDTVVFAAFGLRGLVDLVLASITALPAAFGALVRYGVGTSTGNVAFSTVIQSHVPDRLRGRVFSGFDLIWQGMRLASLVLGGLLADTAGIRAVYYLGGALLVAAALAGPIMRKPAGRKTWTGRDHPTA